MKLIDIKVYASNSVDPKIIKIDDNATIEQLFKEAQAAGAAIGEPGEEITLLVEDKEVGCRKLQKIHECGIKHGHRVHCHPHEIVIIVNARERKWDKKEISFDQVVKLAFDAVSPNPDVVYTVKYSHGPEHNREGSLVKGHSVKVKWGMLFDVTQTNKS
jgi:hypothetical protein